MLNAFLRCRSSRMMLSLETSPIFILIVKPYYYLQTNVQSQGERHIYFDSIQSKARDWMISSPWMTLLAPIFRMLRLALFCLSSIDIETSLASIAKIFPYDHGQFHYIFIFFYVIILYPVYPLTPEWLIQVCHWPLLIGIGWVLLSKPAERIDTLIPLSMSKHKYWFTSRLLEGRLATIRW